MKLERQKGEINTELEQLRTLMKQFEDKAALCEVHRGQ
jgi:hypothetical protein